MSATITAAPPASEDAEVDLVNPVDVTDDQIRHYDRHGFLKIEGLLTDPAIAALREAAENKVSTAETSGGSYGDTFARLTYGLGSVDTFKAIYTHPLFKKLVGELLRTRLIATECNGFELTPGRIGFPWHYGSISFKFIRPEDMGWSLWFPLDDVDPEGQGGGMAYVSQEIASCDYHYRMSSLLARMREEGVDHSEVSAALDKIYGFQGHFIDSVFEKYAVQDSFRAGDCLIFNKNIWHRSSPLREGPLKSRLAVNMRFIDWRSRLDMSRDKAEDETGGGLGQGADYGLQKQTTYASRFVDIADGDEIRESRYCGEIV
ncbi:MAG: phytanoyl-CoA dioxygenase family protein [Azospirillaceae bacterium]